MERFSLEELREILEITLYEDEIRELESMEKRFVYKDLMGYLKHPSYHRICALYGLRRTGKTIMMKQAMLELGLENCRLIEIPFNVKNIDMLDIYTLLEDYQEQGIRYVFLDEITDLDDFVHISNLLADKYAGTMRITVAGKDSYCFSIAADDVLYDRIFLIHTTMIPFAEFSHVFKTNDIDEYIRYGGTMVPPKSESCPLKDGRETKRYIQTAITDNIINSIEKSGRLDDYHSLGLLHYAGLLKPFINKNVELYCGNLPVADINDIFLKEFSLDKEFGEFLKKQEQNRDIIEHTICDCKHFFSDMDILHKILEMSFGIEDDEPNIYELYYIIQPGMKFKNLILFETAYFLNKERYKVFRVKFSDNNGKYDMIVRDKETNGIDLYEIKYSKDFVPAQIKHLENKDHADKITAYYTKKAGCPAAIKNKALLYWGNTAGYKDIACINTAEFLKLLACTEGPYRYGAGKSNHD